MYRIIVMLFFLAFVAAEVQAQNLYCGSSKAEGEVNFINGIGIDTLVLAVPLTPEEEEKGRTMQGYRVQVYSGRDRAQAQRLQQELENFYRIPVYLTYDAPYFKIRVGDFRSRLEAQAMLHELKKQFSTSLLVPDQINFPENEPEN